jgi:acetate kinase
MAAAKDALDHRQATSAIFERSATCSGQPGHGGRAPGRPRRHGFRAPTRVDEEVMARLRKLCPLAPLHQPHNLAPIEAITASAPHSPGRLLRHRLPPQPAASWPRCSRFRASSPRPGVRRYGFHGLSYEYIAKRLCRDRARSRRKGASSSPTSAMAPACARCNGRSVATTMGFTAVDGLVMGTRCGSDRSGRPALPDGRTGWTRGRSRS